MLIVKRILFVMCGCLLAVSMHLAWGKSIDNMASTFRWQSLHGPYGGYVTSLLTLNPTNDNAKIFAGTLNGIFVSNDHGEHWVCALPGYVINKLISDNANVIYAATQQSGILVSADRGKTWNRVKLPLALATTTVNDIVANNNIVYVATEVGAYMSLDHGMSWYTAESGDMTLSNKIKSLVVGTDNSIYAFVMLSVAEKAIVKTTDGGKNWRNLDFKSQEFYATTKLFVDADNNFYASGFLGQIYFYDRLQQLDPWKMLQFPEESWNTKLALNHQTLFAGFYNGDIFTCSNHCQDISSWSSLVTLGYSIFDLFFAVQNLKQTVYAATANGVYASFDDGHTWLEPKQDIARQIVNVLAKDHVNLFAGLVFDGVLLAACDKRDNSWHVPQTNIMALNPIFKPVTYSNNIYFVTDDGMYISNDSGVNWRKNNYYPALMDLMVDKHGTVYLRSDLKPYASYDNGHSWSALPIERAYCLATYNQSTYICGEKERDKIEVLVTQDYGRTWGSKGTPEANFRMNQLAFDANNLYAGGYSINANVTKIYATRVNGGEGWSLVFRGAADEYLVHLHTDSSRHFLYIVTANNGQTPSKIYRYDGVKCQLVYCAPKDNCIGDIVIDPVTGYLFQFNPINFQPAISKNSGTNGLYISTNYGATWTPIPKFNNQQVNDIVVDPANGSMSVGTFANGVYVSKDHGATWSEDNVGLTSLAMKYLFFDDANKLYGITLGAGIFKAT